MIEEKGMPPTRLMRYCCTELKEISAPNRFICTGVRGEESSGRKGKDDFSIHAAKKENAKFASLDHIRSVINDDEKIRTKLGTGENEVTGFDCLFIENAKKQKDLIAMPIYRWINSDVWDFIRDRGIAYNPLYDMGYLRVGCVGCPMSGNQIKELNDLPKYKSLYIKAFDRMLIKRKKDGKDDITGKEGWHKWGNGQDVFDWWVGKGKKYPKGQMNIFDYMEDD